MGAGCANHRPGLVGLGVYPVRKSWRSIAAKAAAPNDPEYQWLHDIADAAAPRVRRAFLEAIARIRGSAKEAELRAAVESGNVETALRVLGLDKTLSSAVNAAIMPPLEDAFLRAGRAAVPVTLPKGGELAMRFDISNPNAARFLQRYSFELVRQVSDDTRAGVRQVVLDAFRFGGHPREQARLIRQMIGLTDKQAQAVDNFRVLLETGDREALTRALRDRRFDPTLDNALGQAAERQLTAEQIDRMVGRYRERMLASRAENIARTETLRAANAAQETAWEQAAQQGLLNRATLRRQWLVTPDDRLCIWCAAVPEMNVGGVPMGGMFRTPLGPIAYPPLHPQCRCVTILEAF